MTNTTATATNSPTLTLHYKGTLADGTQFDSSFERNEPVTVTLGGGELLPTFEQNISTMETGDTTTFTLTPEQAYGERNADAKTTISKGTLPPEVDTSEGAQIPLSSPDGRNWLGTVTGTEDDEIHLDLNHPLAGESLTFTVELLSRSDEGTDDTTVESTEE